MTTSSATDPTGQPKPATSDATPDGPRFSLIIPAHNESKILGAFLHDLLLDAAPGEIETVVVANGCTDNTADIARAHSMVDVIETPIGDKPTSLDLGDAHCTVFPRLYVDADVDVTLDDLRRCADALTGDVHAAAPCLEVDTSGSSGFVKSYYEIWTRLPWTKDQLVGSGIYGMSKEGRGRFENFHPKGADDLWVSAHFTKAERLSVPGTSFTIAASPTARQAVRRKSRIHAANQLISDDIAHLPGTARSGTAAVPDMVREQPSLLGHAMVYTVMTVTARLMARRKIRRGVVAWDGDDRSSIGAKR